MKFNHALLSALGTAVLSSSAFAGAHTWLVNEVFSNASGTVQFVELFCPTGAENFTAGLKVTSDSTGMQATLPGTAGSTLNKNLLLGTAAFAALPGAATPDVIIPANFFNKNGDTVRYHVYSLLTFGALPTNCTDSFNRVGGVAPNSPKNFLGAGVPIDCNPAPLPCPADIAPAGGNHFVNTDDLLAVINAWGACPAPCRPHCAADVAPAGGNCFVNTDDLLAIIGAWGPCP